MSKRLIHVVFGIVLTGCTINQYGARITVGDSNTPTVVDVSLEAPVREQSAVVEHRHNGVQSAGTKPATHTVVKPLVVHQTKNTKCIPMPVIPDPPKMDLEELAKHSTNEKKLQLLFEENHTALFRHSQAIKKSIEAWYANPNHC